MFFIIQIKSITQLSILFKLPTEISLVSENRVVLSVSGMRVVGDGGSDGVHLYHRYIFHNNIRTDV